MSARHPARKWTPRSAGSGCDAIVSSLGIGVKATVTIRLKSGVLDPQGKAIGHALENLGFGGVHDVRQGKVIELELDETDSDRARAQVDAMCGQLLANTVIESYTIEIE